MKNNNIPSASAPLGEQVRIKQGADLRALVTAKPSQRELGSGKGTAVPKFCFQAPKLVRPALTVVQDETARQEALRGLERYKEEIGSFMLDLAKVIRQIQQMPEEEKALASGDWNAIQEAFAQVLNAEDQLAKQLATVAYASAMTRTCPPTRAWVLPTIRDLVEKGFLVELPKPEGPFRPKPGQFFAYGQVYILASEFRKNSNAQKTLTELAELVSQAVAAGREYFESRREEVIALAGPAKAQLSLDQLESPSCPEGFRHLPIPEQGKPLFRKEGGIVVCVQKTERGPAITMVAGYGSVEKEAERIREAGVFLAPVALRSKQLQVSQHLNPAQRWALIAFHRLLRLGIEEARRQEERVLAKQAFKEACKAEYEALRAKASLSPEQFLLEEEEGTAVVHWSPGAFQWRRPDPATKKTVIVPVWFLFALVERNEAGRIRVKECPERLTEFFAGHRDFEFPGQEYAELGKLGVLLRRAKANLQKAAQKAAIEEMAEASNGEASNGEPPE